jgi:2-C-methyl-D-erythritol 4-phosphate cytidylyltransferase
MNVGVIIPAAGAGTRMGGTHKPFLEIGGKPLLQHCLDAFFRVDVVTRIAVALPAALVRNPPVWMHDRRILFVEGGAQRADSVRAGLSVLPGDIDVVVVHDAARPVITPEMIRAVIDIAGAGESATLALPVTDTLHQVDSDHAIIDTPDRSQFWRALTPQAFPRAVLEQAFARVTDASAATDEAGLVARAGFKVRVVPGEASNIKVTTPGDVALAEVALIRFRP